MTGLVIVRPSGGQESTDPPKRRRCPVLSLTAEEASRLRAVLVHLRAQYGSLGCLAAVMGVSPDTLTDVLRRRSPGSPGLLLRAARAAGTTVDRIVAPLASVDVCPHCGARKGAP